MEKVSVIIPVYNTSLYLEEAINSVINQTYKNIEILIINDGSTDNTLKIIEGFSDSRIRIINTENFGLSISRNIGIDNSRGKYLYFVDADDFIEKDTLEYLYKLLIMYNADIATCKCYDINSSDFIIKQRKEKLQILSSEEMLKKVLLTTNREVATWNKLYKKELFNNLRFEKRKVNDILLTHKLVMKSKKIIYSNQIKYYYFNNKYSISHVTKNDYDRLVDRYKASIERYKYIKKKYPMLNENDVSIIQNIARLYESKNEKIRFYLEENNALIIYKKLFSVKKIINCKISIKSKIKLFLFAVSPKLHNFIVNKYLKIKSIS